MLLSCFRKRMSGSRAVAAKRVDDGDDVTDSTAAAAGSKFHNRTLQIFLHEMRAALEQEVTVEQDGKKTYRAVVHGRIRSQIRIMNHFLVFGLI